MAAIERSSGGSSFVRLVTPFIYSGFTKGSLPALGPHALDTHTHTHTHIHTHTQNQSLSHTHIHTQTRTGSIHTSGMAGPLFLRADWGITGLLARTAC